MSTMIGSFKDLAVAARKTTMLRVKDLVRVVLQDKATDIYIENIRYKGIEPYFYGKDIYTGEDIIFCTADRYEVLDWGS